METAKIAVADLLAGARDSFKGFRSVWYIDAINNEKLARRSPTRTGTPRRAQPKPTKTVSTNITPTLTAIKNISKNNTKLVGCYALAYYTISIFLPLVGFNEDSSTAYVIFTLLELLRKIFLALCRFFDSLFAGNIAGATFEYTNVRSKYSLPWDKRLADLWFSICIDVVFLVQTNAMDYVPVRYLNVFLRIVSESLLYSLYAFEYKWSKLGYNACARLNIIQLKVFYFIGFGLPLAVLSYGVESVYWMLQMPVVGILYPFLIISACEANMRPDFRFKVPVLIPTLLFTNIICYTVTFFSKGKQELSIMPIEKEAVIKPRAPSRSSSSSNSSTTSRRYR